MDNSEVRALCAQITLETNAKKCDALIAELTRILTSTRLTLSPQRAEEPKWAQSASQGAQKIGGAVSLEAFTEVTRKIRGKCKQITEEGDNARIGALN